MTAPREMTTEERVAFLAALRELGCVRAAAGVANVAHQRLYARRKSDAEFASAWEIARENWRARLLRKVEEIATTPTPSKPAGDAAVLLDLLAFHDHQRESRAKLALLRAQTKQAELRNVGALPAEKHEVRTTVDLTDPDAVARRLAELLGDDAGPPEPGAAG